VPQTKNGYQFNVNGNSAKWRYRFALGLMDQFTVVSNPESDYYPNVIPTAWRDQSPNQIPSKVPNEPGLTPATVNTQFENATEGLININSASWRTIAAMEMIPKSQDKLYPGTNLSYNEMLAKLIVRYRDFDDGIARTDAGGKPLAPQGHGPFRNLMELNKVFDPTTPANTFRNALGLMTPNVNDPTYRAWGNYAPGPAFFNAAGKIAPGVDNKPNGATWATDTLMANRISNLVSLRSDTFTVYVVVQGWRNAGTNLPELVVQKRLAAIYDRSSLGAGGLVLPSSGGLRTINIPAD
jgi:hypothetical protein